MTKSLEQIQKFKDKRTGEIVEGKIMEDTGGKFIAINKSSANFPHYIVITGSQFYQPTPATFINKQLNI